MMMNYFNFFYFFKWEINLNIQNAFVAYFLALIIISQNKLRKIGMEVLTEKKI